MRGHHFKLFWLTLLFMPGCDLGTTKPAIPDLGVQGTGGTPPTEAVDTGATEKTTDTGSTTIGPTEFEVIAVFAWDAAQQQVTRASDGHKGTLDNLLRISQYPPIGVSCNVDIDLTDIAAKKSTEGTAWSFGLDIPSGSLEQMTTSCHPDEDQLTFWSQFGWALRMGPTLSPETQSLAATYGQTSTTITDGDSWAVQEGTGKQEFGPKGDVGYWFSYPATNVGHGTYAVDLSAEPVPRMDFAGRPLPTAYYVYVQRYRWEVTADED